MANRSADEGRNTRSDDPLRRAATEGPVGGKDASQRAADLAADQDAPAAPRDTGRPDTERVLGVPSAIPAGAAANTSVDNTSMAAGGHTGPQGAPFAAAMIASEVAFGQDDIKSGWDVLAADGAAVGTVAQVGTERMLVDLTDRAEMVYIPYAAVASVDKQKVHLSVPSDLIEQQDWQQVRPGGASGGTSPPRNAPSMTAEPSATAETTSRDFGNTEFAATHAPERAERAEPVTTGRGVEEGPTIQTVRLASPTPPNPGPPQESATRARGAPMPPQYAEEVQPMRQAQDMMNSVRNTVQGATQGQMSPTAPKDAFADMFSFLENIPNSFYYLATVISVISSLVLFVTGKRWESLFVGLWAPTIVSASMFYKLLRPSHEVRRM